MPELAVRAEGLGKQYRIGARQSYRTLRDAITSGFKMPFRAAKALVRRQSLWPKAPMFWALDDVSFEIEAGDVVGIIGRNGAGKSTLLKVLSRITEPTCGRAEIYGRVGSLLEVGTGFHPELTGRENVFLNGAILGMRRSEIRSKLDEIIAFAEVDQFVDTPVKHYSSGMYLRLAFSVAAHLEPEILLVDEVLAVGDANFQKKCLGKMSDISRDGRTVLFVSHNMAAVRQLCTGAIMLSSGAVARAGNVDQVIQDYLATTLSDSAGDLSRVRDRKGAGRIRIREIRFEDGDGNRCAGLVSGQPARIVLSVESRADAPRVQACIAFLDHFGQRLMYLNSHFVGDDIPVLPANGELACEIPRVHLAPGSYRLELWVKSAEVMEDRISDAGCVDVVEGNFFGTGRALAAGFQVALMDYAWQARSPLGEPARRRTARACRVAGEGE
jgi:lipopolysaccharide transport system ATP-binding protein